ncbi:MAG: RNA polymerase sigma factor RpoH [Burkholderiaceae bacterium]|jgi:RNA polymerase sigma-32 factor|nr:RNA polymerase sigma factor RpoH [Burkholderiaceae bacterium]
MTKVSAQTALAPLASRSLTSAITGPVGNIEAYIAEVNRLPMLSHEQETSLALRYRNHNDLGAAQELVMSHLRVVVSIARGYLGYGLPHADLIQEGNIGLMKAVKRFDPEMGVRLVSYAIHWIKAEIHEYILKNWRMVKVATTKAQRKLFFNLRSHKKGSEAMTGAQIDSLAEKLNVRREDVLEMETRMNGHDIALEPSADSDDESAFAPISYLSSDAGEPTKVLEALESERLQTEGLSEALARLDPRSRRIIEARWLAGDEHSATLHTLAEEFGVSAERIRQIEAAAMKKMKTALIAYQ